MRYFSADCILPVSGDPVYDSVLAINIDGSVDGIYHKDDLKNKHVEIRHFDGILCPGFVNTHCHLELSWAKGLISDGGGLDQFIWQLEKFRKSISETFIHKAIENEAYRMEQSGIVATADIANGPHTLDYKTHSHHYYHTFIEVFGSNPEFAKAIYDRARQLYSDFSPNNSKNTASITPHATYSLSHELFRLLQESANGGLISIHHQENTDENTFFYNGTGPIAKRRKAFNPDLPAFPFTGKRPMESIAAYFNPNQKLLLVHNTVSEQQDVDFVQQNFNDVYWCLCPNANQYIEQQLPDINLLRENHCRITIGTDSLASNSQLSILEEMKTIQQHFPEIPLTELVNWATINGATYLGLEQKSGSFEKGKNPGVVLIENADPISLKLRVESTSRLIIPATL